MPSIRSLGELIDVGPAVAQIEANPQFWNKYTTRTAGYGSPHGVSDIWVRYNAWSNYAQCPARFNEKHKSVWYPCVQTLTELGPLISRVCTLVQATKLGGVLITRIAPGDEVKPHVDKGWHAGYYKKVAVQLRSAPGQRFCFADSWLEPAPGEIYTFDNSQLHWVTNKSKENRMTLIICVRTKESL